MNSRKLSAPFKDPPKPDMLSLDGVFKEITTKPSSEAQEEKEVIVIFVYTLEYNNHHIFRLTIIKVNGRNLFETEKWKLST